MTGPPLLLPKHPFSIHSSCLCAADETEQGKIFVRSIVLLINSGNFVVARGKPASGPQR